MSQENRETPPPPAVEAEASPAVPPEESRPWYYQFWFLYPMIPFWPLWSILIIRSPWHNGLVMGALAWAWLIVGGGLTYFRMQEGGTVALSTLAWIAPGLLFTVIVQAHWIRNRRRIMETARAAPSPAAGTEAPSSRSRRALRRRSRGRR
ncbi:MAG: hypothetical protein OXE17_05375 [Chloroflexi bacterium]|nr:hypothetical protein [Chloroflexota bacterium]